MSNTEGNSENQLLRPRSLSIIDREIEQVRSDLERDSAVHRLQMAEINRTIDMLDAEIQSLSTAGQDFDRYHHSLRLSMPGPLDLGPPSLPIDDSVDGDVPAPLTPAGTRFVKQLPDLSLDDVPNEISCNICMESFGSTENPEPPVRLPCGHVMGRNCISQWLTTSNSCPLCRRVLFQHDDFGSPLTETELRNFLSSAAPLTESGWTDLLEATRSEMEADGLRDFLETTGLSVGDAASFVAELGEITVGQASIETRVARLAAGDVVLIPARRTGLRELQDESEQLDARMASFRLRHGI